MWGWQLENNVFGDEDQDLCCGVEGRASDDGSCHVFAEKTEASLAFFFRVYLRSLCLL